MAASSAPQAPADAPRRLTDRRSLDAFRARARRRGRPSFLDDLVADELNERLTAVNRRFTSPAVVTPVPEIAAAVCPGATVVPDAEVLDLAPEAHDLVIHAMGLHWADDPVGQLIQCRRALVPDGLFLGVAPGGETLTELRQVLVETEATLTGGAAPRVAPMADVRDLGTLLQRAGLALPVADRLATTVTYPDLPALVADLRALGETNALADRDRRTPARTLFAEAGAAYAARYPAEDGRIAATLELMFLSGWAPSPDQPQPLKPGSANTALADALSRRDDPQT